MKIKTITELKAVLDKLNIDYTVKTSGNKYQFKTLTYAHNGKVRWVDSYHGGRIIGVWL